VSRAGDSGEFKTAELCGDGLSESVLCAVAAIVVVGGWLETLHCLRRF
jgi:hypothetical protein